MLASTIKKPEETFNEIKEVANQLMQAKKEVENAKGEMLADKHTLQVEIEVLNRIILNINNSRPDSNILPHSNSRGRMVVWYTFRAILPSRVWVAEAHAPLETGESWFESSKTLTPHFSPGHVCDDVEGTQDSRGWLKCVPTADIYG
ncbi:hypothetical protein K3495_g14382 [Podosphaera aphanis]|nr:hypothetical protein K3495_g14382 [Podosphaera aphanis]